MGMKIGIGLGLTRTTGVGGGVAPPDAYTVDQWTLTYSDVDGAWTVSILEDVNLNGGTASGVDYRVDGGSWISSGLNTIPGDFLILGLSGGENVQIARVSNGGRGAASDVKVAGAPSAAVRSKTYLGQAENAVSGNVITKSVDLGEYSATAKVVVLVAAAKSTTDATVSVGGGLDAVDLTRKGQGVNHVYYVAAFEGPMPAGGGVQNITATIPGTSSVDKKLSVWVLDKSEFVETQNGDWSWGGSTNHTVAADDYLLCLRMASSLATDGSSTEAPDRENGYVVPANVGYTKDFDWTIADSSTTFKFNFSTGPNSSNIYVRYAEAA